MANEDPAGIPEQIRQNRPFFAVLILALLIAIGTFLFVLSRDTETKDIERNVIQDPNAPPPAAPAPATGAAPAAAPEAATAPAPAPAPAATPQ